MDQLAIVLKPMKYSFETNGVVHENETPVVEFVINGQALSRILRIKRDLDNCGCDLDPGTKKTLPAVYDEFIDVLAGNAPPHNQFGTPRAVLYRCHCGCDYCGVISCAISRSGQTITWGRLGYENDHPPKRGRSYTFDLDAYLAEIARFVKESA